MGLGCNQLNTKISFEFQVLTIILLVIEIFWIRTRYPYLESIAGDSVKILISSSCKASVSSFKAALSSFISVVVNSSFFSVA